jgi:catechol 2,3-dioxygenase-like lactoylglutathione lyase family enzyme
MNCEGYMLITKDLQKAKQFYTEIIGANIILELDKHIVFKEGFSLLLESDWCVFAELNTAACNYNHNTGQLVFEVEDIEPFLQKISFYPELHLLHQVKEHPWGRHAIRLYDPDGHVVEVGESMATVIKRFLRQGLSLEETARRSEFPLDFVLKCKNKLQEK